MSNKLLSPIYHQRRYGTIPIKLSRTPTNPDKIGVLQTPHLFLRSSRLTEIFCQALTFTTTWLAYYSAFVRILLQKWQTKRSCSFRYAYEKKISLASVFFGRQRTSYSSSGTTDSSLEPDVYQLQQNLRSNKQQKPQKHRYNKRLNSQQFLQG